MLNQPLLDARRIVIKLGTQVVIDSPDTPHSTVAVDRLSQVVAGCAKLVHEGREVILVSSGAVGLGQQKLELNHNLNLSEKQACAAVGQNLLMDVYQWLFGQHKLFTGQVLLSAHDFAERQHYLNLVQTMKTLLGFGVVPIVNENDFISSMELQDEDFIKGFDDNDKLSSLVAAKMDADLLLILTTVDGIYTENPTVNPDAQRIATINNLDELNQVETAGRSTMGRGGMSSKLEAARLASISGMHTYITSGFRDHPLEDLRKPVEEMKGTLVYPETTCAISGRKRWIGMASGYHGVVKVNEGACKALRDNRASLLPIGVLDVEGDFLANQVISICDEMGNELGRGLSDFSSAEIMQIKGHRSESIPDVLGEDPVNGDRQVLIHRDNLVIFEEYGIS